MIINLHNNIRSTAFIIINADVVIGFINAPYEVNENDGEALIRVGLINGNLQREVSIQLSLSDGIASSKFL